MNEIRKARENFKDEIQCASLEITEIAKDVAPAIGEVSVIEVKQRMVAEFAQRIGVPFLRDPFNLGR